MQDKGARPRIGQENKKDALDKHAVAAAQLRHESLLQKDSLKHPKNILS
jgi:hypothetical protein